MVGAVYRRAATVTATRRRARAPWLPGSGRSHRWVRRTEHLCVLDGDEVVLGGVDDEERHVLLPKSRGLAPELDGPGIEVRPEPARQQDTRNEEAGGGGGRPGGAFSSGAGGGGGGRPPP